MIISVHSVLSYNTNKPIRAKTKLLKNIYLEFSFSIFFSASLISFWNELKSDNTEWSNSKMEWRETETMTEKRLLAHDGRTTVSTPDKSAFRPWLILSWVCPLGEVKEWRTELSPGFVSGHHEVSLVCLVYPELKTLKLMWRIFFFLCNRKSWNWLFDDKKN